jgi:iron complex outermembrane receptor protein
MSKAATTTWSRAGLFLGVSLGALIFTNPALAQDAPAEPTPPPSNEDVVQDEQGQNVPEGATTETDATTIVVTGSRIRQPEFTSPDPVSLIDPQIAQREGKTDTASMLQSSPIAAGSTQITSAISSNFVTNGGPGAQTVDLRGLGPNRTLVLLNGRRAGPAGTRGAVSSFDLNVLPQSIVSRIDILKTGASSIYGSDAVAGVVNMITKTEFDGFQIDGSVTAPLDAGGEQYRITGMWGKKFDRGHVTIAADYFKQNELSRGQRSYLECPEAYIFNQDGSRADLTDPRTGEYKCEDLRWGHVWTYDLEYQYDGDGDGELDGFFGNLNLANGLPQNAGGYSAFPGGIALMQYQYPGENLGLPTPVFQPGEWTQFAMPAGWYPTGYTPATLAVQNSSHPFMLDQSIIPRTERKTIYAEAAFNLTDNIEAFGEFLFNRRETYQNGWRQIWNFGFTSDNTYIPSLNDPQAAGWEGWNLLSATAMTQGGSDTEQKVDYYRGVAGLRGDFGSSGFLSGWSYDGYVQYSRNKGIYRAEQFLQEVYDQGVFNSSPTCVGTNLPSGTPCMDVPWYDPFFLRGETSQALYDYMFEWEQGKTIYTQLNGEASISGSLFELPGGPLGIALGVTARKDKINDTPGELTRSGGAWGTTTSGITAGQTITKEAFGELSIPLLKDRPFFDILSFSAAARVTNVEAKQAGTGVTDKDTGNWTYKLGANWAPTNWLRFRGTYGTSFRAPALFEQFLADETSSFPQRSVDPCIQTAVNQAIGAISARVAQNCTADGVGGNHLGGGVTADVLASGGIGTLDPETSKALTASVILTPNFGFLPDTRLSLAVDYFDIRVKGEVTQLGPYNILYACYDSPDFPNDPICDLFTRGQTGAPNNVATVVNNFINVSEQRNRGIDAAFNVRHNLGGLGSLNILANATWQIEDSLELFPGNFRSLNGRVGDPKFIGDLNVTWQTRNGWSLFYGMDIIGGSKNSLKDYIEANGAQCVTFQVRGNYCVDLKTPRVFYHSASITKEIGKKFDITLGLTNILDTRPPRISVLNQSLIATLGGVAAVSQYEFVGRRAFLNVTRRF